MIAVHLAFPALLAALFASICVAILFLLIYPLALVDDRMTDSIRRQLLDWLDMTHVVLVGITYIFTVAYLVL